MAVPPSSIARRRVFKKVLRQGIFGVLQSSKEILLIRKAQNQIPIEQGRDIGFRVLSGMGAEIDTTKPSGKLVLRKKLL